MVTWGDVHHIVPLAVSFIRFMHWKEMVRTGGTWINERSDVRGEECQSVSTTRFSATDIALADLRAAVQGGLKGL